MTFDFCCGVARRHSQQRFVRRTFPDVLKQEIRCGGGEIKTMKIFSEIIKVSLRDDSKVEDSSITLPSTAWAKIWTRVQNPFGFGETWVCFPCDPYTERLPAEGEYMEAGTACKTVRGEVVASERQDGVLTLTLRQPSFPYDGPPIHWGAVISGNALRADRLGMEGRRVAMIDGAYNSIMDGGDVAVSLPAGNTPVSSTLKGLTTWTEYQELRREKIPNGGAIPEREQQIRDMTYLCAGNRAMAESIA